jgi:hypothetical protein
LAEKLKLAQIDSNIAIKGINGDTVRILKRISATISSKYTSYSETLRFEVMDEVVGTMPAVKLNLDNWTVPKNVTLADESFIDPSEVDVLLGAAV